MRPRVFGKLPSGDRLKRIQASPNYHDHAFHNQTFTPMLSEEASYFRMIRKTMEKDPARAPAFILPVVTTGFPKVGGAPVLTWFGHSSYLIQSRKLNLLVDPVFSTRVSFSKYVGPKAYPRAAEVELEKLPPVDAVILTHDHYDHLDYHTIRKLRKSVKAFYAPLGVGSHLSYWGVPEELITELDWGESAALPGGATLTATPARHFSGRSFMRNKTLWASFVLDLEDQRLYLGGDSGYGPHFREIGEEFGPFDLVILENGQYNPLWPFIHMMPEETVQASLDLKGKVLLPVHWGKYTLAYHAWDDPIVRLTKKAAEMNVRVTTPRIGEAVVLGEHYPASTWWQLA